MGGNLSWLVIITTKEERIVTAASLAGGLQSKGRIPICTKHLGGECGRGEMERERDRLAF